MKFQSLMAKKYQIVIVGTKPGIYSDWATAGPCVEGFPGKIHKGADTLKELLDMIDAANNRGHIDWKTFGIENLPKLEEVRNAIHKRFGKLLPYFPVDVQAANQNATVAAPTVAAPAAAPIAAVTVAAPTAAPETPDVEAPITQADLSILKQEIEALQNEVKSLKKQVAYLTEQVAQSRPE